MSRLLIGERNLEHRSVLKENLGQMAPSLTLDFVGNGEDILGYLSEHAADGEPIMIILDTALPSIFDGSLIPLIKADERYSKIPIVILAEQAGREYYTARNSGLARMALLKPSKPTGWTLLAQKIISLTLENDS